MPPHYRLALDTGTNSIGWCLFTLDSQQQPSGILDMGVSIFSDGRDEKSTSLAVERRTARGMRRRLFRAKERKKALVAALTDSGLLPADLTLNPYKLRAEAVIRPLDAPELGRALFHLAQRRGFKSNRRQDEKESKKMAAKINRLKSQLQGRTLGQYLYEERTTKGLPARFRPHVVLLDEKNQDPDIERGIYADRALVHDEFKRIRETQQSHHRLTPKQWDSLENIIFYQRALKPGIRGKCRFIKDKPCAHSDLPLTHRFRIAQELRNLVFTHPLENRSSRRLSNEEFEILYNELCNKKSLTFNSLRKKIKLTDDWSINLESETRKELKGDKTSYTLRSDTYFGKRWDEFTPER